MKERIERLSNGIYEYNAPKMEISIERLNFVIKKGEVYKNSFLISSKNNIEIAGMIYSSNRRMSLLTENFRGLTNTIEYEFDGRGLEEGDIVEGKFNIISNAGEIVIPYEVSIEVDYVESSLGKIRNLFHFANLAQTNYSEAVRIFKSEKFRDVFLKGNIEQAAVYDTLMRSTAVENSLEEFLINLSKKSKINLSVDVAEKTYTDVRESFKDSIEITKDSWGYIEIEAECKDEFIRLDKKKIMQEDFVGSTYNLEYIIDEKHLHRGNNYGSIIISTKSQQLEIKVTVSNSQRREHNRERELRFRLFDDLLRVRNDAYTVDEWMKNELLVVEELRHLCPDSAEYELYHAHLLIIDKHYDEAKWIVEDVEKTMDEEDQLYDCYLKFLKSKYSKDAEYTNQVLEDLVFRYENGDDRWQMLWLIIYLLDKNDETYEERLRLIKAQFYKGCISPFIYIEAVEILNKYPANLRELESFEKQILLFASRQNNASNDLIDQFTFLAEMNKGFDEQIFKIMTNFYAITHSDKLLSSICSILIRANKTDNKYFTWYKLAAERELKITQLYEYYMYSINRDYDEEFPKMVLMYFIYNNRLDYELKAFMYANIVKNQKNNPTMYRSYLKHMERFTFEQINEGHINNDLALLYSTFIGKTSINAQMASIFPKILFSYEVVCQNRDIKNIIVAHKELGTEVCYPVKDGRAVIHLYTENPVIILEDSRHYRYIYNVPYEIRRYMDTEDYMKICYDLNKSDKMLTLYFSEKCLKYNRNDMQTLELYKSVMGMADAKEDYKKQILKSTIDYYYNNYDGDNFEVYLLEFDRRKLNMRERMKIIECLIVRGMYEEAYNSLRNFGSLKIDAKMLLKFASYKIRNTEYAYDDMILNICENAFIKGKYNDITLEYLIEFYKGNTKDMINVFKASKEFEIDTYLLEEKIIKQALYSRTYSSALIEVFESYCRHEGNDNIIRAYLSYYSYIYLVKDRMIDVSIFDYVLKEIKKDSNINDTCKIAYLRYLSEKVSMTVEEKDMASNLLTEYCDKKLYFEFFKDFTNKIHIPYILKDKKFIEYKTNPDNKVCIHYILETGSKEVNTYKIEEIPKVYEGIFSIQFTMFYGDRLQYYITEDNGREELLTESGSIVIDNYDDTYGDSKYDMINDMVLGQELHDELTTEELVYNYIAKNSVVAKAFKIM